MIFNRISIDGFGIIGNKVTINFPDQGKIGISGNNESGKSTLFDAIRVVWKKFKFKVKR